jgi:hypothetical protein
VSERVVEKERAGANDGEWERRGEGRRRGPGKGKKQEGAMISIAQLLKRKED